MLRSIYLSLLRLHPSRFRREYAEEMLWIFDQTISSGRRARFLADGLLSLVRQWAYLGGHGEQAEASVAIQTAGPPMFHTVAPLKMRPAALINGVLATVVSFGIVWLGAISGGKRHNDGRLIVLPQGDHVPAPVLARDGQSAEGARAAPNSRDQLVPQPSEPQITEQPRQRLQAGSYFSTLLVLRALDVNHDGILAAEEITQASNRLSVLDRDRDGALTAHECGFREDFANGTPDQYMRVHRIHRALDADGNSVISPAEVGAAPSALRVLDLTQDGQIDAYELLRPR